MITRSEAIDLSYAGSTLDKAIRNAANSGFFSVIVDKLPDYAIKELVENGFEVTNIDDKTEINW